MPSSSTQQIDKGKEKTIEPSIDDEEGKHETEHEFQLFDLNEEDEKKIINAVMKGKVVKISELQAILERAKYVIHFLEHENQQLKTKHVINEVKLFKAQKEAEKAKSLLEETLENFDEPNDDEDQPPRQRPRTRGLKRALALERQREV